MDEWESAWAVQRMTRNDDPPDFNPVIGRFRPFRHCSPRPTPHRKHESFAPQTTLLPLLPSANWG